MVAATGLAGQLVRAPATFRPAASGNDEPPARGIDVVPALVAPTMLASGSWHEGLTSLPLGIDFRSGSHHTIDVPDGEHVVVIGGARTGRSSTLVRLAEGWRQAHPDGRVLAIVPRRRSALAQWADECGVAVAPDTFLLNDSRLNDSLLILVDDAEMVDDPGGGLAALAAGGRANTWIVAAGRPDALRQLYGHWTTVVRRSRSGLVLTGGNDLDGDLLGVVLPRRTPVPARPGLAWSVANGAVSLTQIALSAAHDPRPNADPIDKYRFANGRIP